MIRFRYIFVCLLGFMLFFLGNVKADAEVLDCVYNTRYGRISINFDCADPTFTCTSGSYGNRCTINTTNFTIADLETDNESRPYACPTNIYYYVDLDDESGFATYDIYAINNGPSSLLQATLNPSLSTQNVNENSCKNSGGDTVIDTEYDWVCEYENFTLRFNTGDTSAVTTSSIFQYNDVIVRLRDSTACPTRIYEICNGDDTGGKCVLLTSAVASTGDNANVLDRVNGEKVDVDDPGNQSFQPNGLCSGENCNISLALFCNDGNVARTLKFIGLAFFIAKILVPAIIIVVGIVDLIKVITSGKEEDMKKHAKNIGMRVVIGVLIFLLPSIIDAVYDVASDIVSNGGTSAFDNCEACLMTPNSSACYVEESED